jgi:hypothetical protein
LKIKIHPLNTKALDLEYNSQLPRMVIPEYGRSVQKMVDYALTIQNREERNRIARSIITIMGQLNPHLRDTEDYNHKLWAHLFIISDFKLDVDSPYPKPSRETFQTKPEIVPYPQSKIRYGHYGKSIEKLIKAGINMENGAEKEEYVRMLANLMKRTYLTWNRNTVEDETILKQLHELSEGQLRLSDSDQLSQTSDLLKNTRSTQAYPQNKPHRRNNKGQKNNRNFKKRTR